MGGLGSRAAESNTIRAGKQAWLVFWLTFLLFPSGRAGNYMENIRIKNEVRTSFERPKWNLQFPALLKEFYHCFVIALTESEQIHLLKTGDSAAFERFVKEYQNKIYNTCLGILQNPEDAEDITQEVFISVYRSVHRFREQSTLSTWLYRIAVTAALDLLRKKKRKKRFALVRTLLGAEDKISIPDFHHPGVQLENKERAAILFKAIDELPEKQKTAFILHKLESLSYSDIANILNVSLSSVESLMFRAKQQLRKRLSGYYEKNER